MCFEVASSTSMPASSIRRSSRLASNGMDDAAGLAVVSMSEAPGVPSWRLAWRRCSAGWWAGLAVKTSPADARLECQPYLTLAGAVGNVARIHGGTSCAPFGPAWSCRACPVRACVAAGDAGGRAGRRAGRFLQGQDRRADHLDRRRRRPRHQRTNCRAPSRQSHPGQSDHRRQEHAGRRPHPRGQLRVQPGAQGRHHHRAPSSRSS